MRKFIFKAATFFVLITIVPMVLAFVLPSNPTNYLLAYGIQSHHEKTTRGLSPRVLLIGSSELAFGIDSKQMEDSLQIPVVNMGLHGGLGQDLVMRNALTKAKSGDICVVSVTAIDKRHGEGNGSTLPFFVDLYPQKASLLNSANIRETIVGTYYMLMMKSVFLARKASGRNAIDPIYNVSNFNSRGDCVGHLKDKREHAISTSTSFSKEKIALDYLDVYVRYLKELQHRGCKVIVIPSLLAKPTYEMTEEAYQTLEMEFAKRGFPYAVPQREMALDINCFYNDNRHANAIGRQKYTLSMIEILEKFPQ